MGEKKYFNNLASFCTENSRESKSSRNQNYASNILLFDLFLTKKLGTKCFCGLIFNAVFKQKKLFTTIQQKENKIQCFYRIFLKNKITFWWIRHSKTIAFYIAVFRKKYFIYLCSVFFFFHQWFDHKFNLTKKTMRIHNIRSTFFFYFL